MAEREMDMMFEKNQSQNSEAIAIVKGDANVKQTENPVYQWFGPINANLNLTFEKAYQIERKDWDKGIVDCTYRIYGREFTDLSCMKGTTLEEIPDEGCDEFEIRQHEDGIRFLYCYSSIPTFDSGDREWGSHSQKALYCDDRGIHLISCLHGYKIGRISVYLGLQSAGERFEKWLEYLQCENPGVDFFG